MKTPEYYNEQLRILRTKLMDAQLELVRRKHTIKLLTELVDTLRQPYNNSKYHDLYLMATNKLNDLDDREELVR